MAEQLKLPLYQINSRVMFIEPNNPKLKHCSGFVVCWDNLHVYVAWISSVNGKLHDPMPMPHDCVKIID